ncbi:MAG: hypothetical protein NC827_09255 [Candidatus Omnitrophica bacterium]|nr:hypothetical protein [Candidatus Omnitrophota bacterium]
MNIFSPFIIAKNDNIKYPIKTEEMQKNNIPIILLYIILSFETIRKILLSRYPISISSFTISVVENKNRYGERKRNKDKEILKSSCIKTPIDIPIIPKKRILTKDEEYIFLR